MSSKLDDNGEESFIILGSSPPTSDIKLNGDVLLKEDINDALKDLSLEGNMAFKAHFKLGDCPSPSSLMVASNIISDDRSTKELQKKFGEILDENLILKETLRKNNESIKEQFLLISSCQDDMMKTHEAHKEKFEQMKELVEKLREENKCLKQQQSQASIATGAPGDSLQNGGPRSVMEFVTSPDEDTINKLTQQLNLVEKQRRQVIVDNEKLTWQKESLEKIVDVAANEKLLLKEKVAELETKLSTQGADSKEVASLQRTIAELQKRILETSFSSSKDVEIKQRDEVIEQLHQKMVGLQGELKKAQLKILDLENVKLEYSKYKSESSVLVRNQKEQINELRNKLKEAETIMFQPVRFSINMEECSKDDTLEKNIKLYDRTLKHLADLLNALTQGTSDSLAQVLDAMSSINQYRLDNSGSQQIELTLGNVRQLLEKQHGSLLNNIGQVKGIMSIFEGVFQDYKKLSEKTSSSHNNSQSNSTEALTAALLARAQELDEAKLEIKSLQTKISAQQRKSDDVEFLKAQLDVYKSDFEAERQAREKMASEKEDVAAELRLARKKNLELTEHLKELKRMNPDLYKVVTTAKTSPSTTASSSGNASVTGNMVYTCPKCMQFSSDQYKAMEDHFDFCLDEGYFMLN